MPSRRDALNVLLSAQASLREPGTGSHDATVQSSSSAKVMADPPAPARRVSYRTPSRADRVALTVHVPTGLRHALKVLAAQERTTVEALVVDALNRSLSDRGLPIHPLPRAKGA